MTEDNQREANNEETTDQDKVEIDYQESRHYTEFTFSGARGGPQPNGDFKIDFYTESYADPAEEYYEIEDGQIGNVTDESDVTMTRRKQATAFVSEENAYRFGVWVVASVMDVPATDLHDYVTSNFEGGASGRESKKGAEQP